MEGRKITRCTKNSCVEYLSAGRWMDIANQEHGLTWTTVETPLVQVGAMVNESPDEHGLRQWRKEIIPGSTGRI